MMFICKTFKNSNLLHAHGSCFKSDAWAVTIMRPQWGQPKKGGKRWQRCLVDEQKTLMPATAWQDRCKSTWIRHRRKKKSKAKLFKGVASNPDKTYFLAVFVLFMWGIIASNKKIEISMNGCKADMNFSWMLAMIFLSHKKHPISSPSLAHCWHVISNSSCFIHLNP